MANKKFMGFYLSLLPIREELEYMIFNFYNQLLQQMDMYDANTKQIKVTGIDNVGKLSHGNMSLERSPPPNPLIPEINLDFVIFRGDYIKVFREGQVLLGILNKILTYYRQTECWRGLNLHFERFQEKGPNGNVRKYPFLRTFYWFVDQSFVSFLPAQFQVAFSVDCLLYGEWQVAHPNLVGLHMLALTWMLGVKEFQKYMPEGMRHSPVVLEHPFRQYLGAINMQISLPLPKEKRGEEAKVTTAKVATKA